MKSNVKSLLLHHGGTVFGKALNKPEKLANTLLCFMLVCMFGGPKSIIKMLLVKELDADFQFEQTMLLLDTIRKAWGDVLAIVCDGNRVNQAFFKKFDTDKPWLTNDGLFLLYDFVHLIKNIRNNWITEKTQELVFHNNGLEQRAKWSHLKELFELEKHQTVKMSKLSEVEEITK